MPRRTKKSEEPQASGSNAGGLAADHLRSFIERIERLEEEKKGIADDIKAVYAEAKGNGFDAPTIRAIVKLRKQKPSEREEKQALLDLYMHAIGMAGEIEEAQQKGIDAASSGAAVTDNPYTTEDPRFKKWEQGWQAQTGILAAQNAKETEEA